MYDEQIESIRTHILPISVPPPTGKKSHIRRYQRACHDRVRQPRAHREEPREPEAAQENERDQLEGEERGVGEHRPS